MWRLLHFALWFLFLFFKMQKVSALVLLTAVFSVSVQLVHRMRTGVVCAAAAAHGTLEVDTVAGSQCLQHPIIASL